MNAASKAVDLVQRAGENGPKDVTDGALVREVHEVERASGVVQFAGADAEAVIAAQRRAKGREIFRQAAERVHQGRGAETDPKPKSVSRLYPPDSRAAGAPPRTGSSAA